MAALFLDLGTRRKRVVNVTPRRLTPGKGPRTPLTRRLCVPHSRYGSLREEENIFPLLRFKPRTVQPEAKDRSLAPSTAV